MREAIVHTTAEMTASAKKDRKSFVISKQSITFAAKSEAIWAKQYSS
jgi:hypothetical protein